MRELPASNPPPSLTVQQALCIRWQAHTINDKHTPALETPLKETYLLLSVVTEWIIQLWEGIKSRGKPQFKNKNLKKKLNFPFIGLWGFSTTHLGSLFGNLKYKAHRKVSSRLLAHVRTEATTALHCSSGVQLDLCISVSHLRSTRMGKISLPLRSAWRKQSPLALQELREMPLSLPEILLALAYPS